VGLSLQEKSRIRYHLGYPQVQAAASIQIGLPATTQTLFLVEYSMENVLEEAIPQIRSIISVLDSTELNLMAAQERLAAAQLGSMVLRSAKAGESEPDALEREYVRWARRLGDVFGCVPNPFAQRFRSASGARIVRRG
jgi:hypothetical protein